MQFPQFPWPDDCFLYMLLFISTTFETNGIKSPTTRSTTTLQILTLPQSSIKTQIE